MLLYNVYVTTTISAVADGGMCNRYFVFFLSGKEICFFFYLTTSKGKLLKITSVLKKKETLHKSLTALPVNHSVRRQKEKKRNFNEIFVALLKLKCFESIAKIIILDKTFFNVQQ